MSSSIRSGGLVAAVSMLAAAQAWADPYSFSTGNVTNQMAVATRPSSPGKFEIEAGDDFLTTQQTTITSASFTGLLVGAGAAPTIGEIVVEMYRVFPSDSNVARTSGPPTFSTSQVPTRVNSPSDVAFDSRDSATSGELSFTTTVLASGFTASNSVQPGGIHPAPGQTTGGNGTVAGTEVRINVTFTSPFVLPADHFFFVPQVQVTGGEFYWLSGSRPIVAPGTPFLPDLQSWTRDANLDPDWLRVGTDIVGGATPPTFNQAFSLTGTVAAIPEPETWAMLLAGLAGVAAVARRTRRAAQ